MKRQNSKPKDPSSELNPFVGCRVFRNQKDYCQYILNGVKREKQISANATCTLA